MEATVRRRPSKSPCFDAAWSPPTEANTVKALTMDEARRIASNIAPAGATEALARFGGRPDLVLARNQRDYYGQIIFHRPKMPCFQKQLGLTGGPQLKA
jgi:hypothetical protein